MKYLIFSDLDGTLIDHHTYSTLIAKKALKSLNARHIPVIFCSSKTYEEQAYLQKQLKYNHPFIIENGSAIVFPNHYFNPSTPENAMPISDHHHMITLAQKDIHDIHHILENINQKKNTPLYGFTKATLTEIAEATELNGDAVQRAQNRWFTDTLMTRHLLQEDVAALENHGFCLSKGGRFLTIQDSTIDKGKSLLLVTQLFANWMKVKPFTIGIGDSANDAAMLKVVDKAFLVQKPDKTWTDIEVEGLIRIDDIGPEGFLKMTTLL